MGQLILVVDGGGGGTAQACEQVLCPLGCDIAAVRTAQSAIETLQRDACQLVIATAELPDESGLELAAELRNRSRFADVPFILVTGDQSRSFPVLARRAGVDEVIVSPCVPEVLEVAVRQLLRLYEARQALDSRANEVLRHYQEQRAFLESLVHDLKNPIAIAQVNIAWAVDRVAGETSDLADALGDAHEGIARLQKMVDDLLIVGMLDQERMALKREYIPMTQLFHQVLKSNEREARARNVSLTMDMDEGVGVVGDPAVLHRAVSSLVESSLRHTQASGRIALSAREGAGIEITISNTGRPLAPEEKAQLLEKQKSAGARPPPMGALGLYFCKRAVEAHDGVLEVRETTEWPTSLVMRLPIRRSG